MTTQENTKKLISSKTADLLKKVRNIVTKTKATIEKKEIEEKDFDRKLDEEIRKEKLLKENLEKKIAEKKEELKELTKILDEEKKENENLQLYNQNLQSEISENENTKKNLENILSSVIRRNENLVSEIKNLDSLKRNDCHQLANLYKKILKINIEQVKYNQLKISFLNKELSYFILDFSTNDGQITEMCPNIMTLESANSILKKEGDFHRFLKVMRNLFLQRSN